METGLYLPDKPLTVLSPQVSGSSQSIYSGAKVEWGPRTRENLLYILPSPILGLRGAQKVIPNPFDP